MQRVLIMEAHHEAKVTDHINSLDPAERRKWVNSANNALQNTHDHEHESWEPIKSFAKWLGIGTGTVAAGGTVAFGLKRLAQYIARH